MSVSSRRSAATPAGTVTVRRATLDDLPIIVELRLALLRENEDHPVYGRLRPDARARAFHLFGAQLRASDETMLVAEQGARIVGIARCVDSLNSPLLDPPRYCYLSSVYVRPDVRRRGILRALLEAARSWCADRGLDEIRLHNVPDGAAAAAWDAAGFAVVEQVRARRLR